MSKLKTVLVCAPEAILTKDASQIEALKRAAARDVTVEAITKPVQAVQRAKSLVGAPTAVCVLAVHSKFFNFTKDPFAATLFKAIKEMRLPAFAFGKESACDGRAEKYHWYMGPDGGWDIPGAAKRIAAVLDGRFTEGGFVGRPLRRPHSAALAMSGDAPFAGGLGMGMGGSMMGGGMMGGGGMPGSPMGGGSMGGTAMYGMGGQPMSPTGGMGAIGMMGGMGGMGMTGGMGGLAGGMGGMSGGVGAMTGGSSGSPIGMGGMSGGIGGGGMQAFNASGSLGGVAAPRFEGGASLGSSPTHAGMSLGAAGSTPSGRMGGSGMAGARRDIVGEVEAMAARGATTEEVVKALAREVQRLSVVVSSLSGHGVA